MLATSGKPRATGKAKTADLGTIKTHNPFAANDLVMAKVMGLDVNGMRPQIVINLAASRAEGAIFSAQLLKLVRLTGPETSGP